MPQLKQLSCCLQWSDTAAPFQEYGTVYGDGVVETFVVVPNEPCTFTIRLKSHGFIHGGLAMIVFIDGNYQCNRSRVNLQPVNKEQPAERTEIDFLLRQKEKSHGDGIYMGRQWRFDNHNIIADPSEGYKDGHFDDLGTIEIIVLRCDAFYHEDADYDGFSSGEDSNIFGERPTREEPEGGDTTMVTNGNNETMANDTAVEPAAEDDVGGLFGLFDGPSDRYGPYQSHGGQWIWHPHQTSDDFTFITSSGTSQRPPQRPQFRIPNYNPPYTQYPRQWPGHHPQTPHQPERRVHWDLGPGSDSSRQSYQNHFHGDTHHHGTQYQQLPTQRPQSRERVRSQSQTSTGPPYPPQQMHLPSQVNPPTQMNPLPSINQVQQINSAQLPNAPSYAPHSSSQTQQQCQSWHPEQSHNPGPMGNSLVSEHTNQTQPEAHPGLFPHGDSRDKHVPQSHPTWLPESDPTHQNNFGVTASEPQPTVSQIRIPDANSQQFANQVQPFPPLSNLPLALRSHQDVPFAPQQMHGRPPHFAPWSIPPPYITFPYPQHLPMPPLHVQSVPHVTNPPNQNSNQPQASFSVPPTEGISPRNTIFNQAAQGPEMNTGSNGWQNHDADASFQNINNNKNGGWNAQENGEASNNQHWNGCNQNGANDATNNWESNGMNGQDNNKNDTWQSNNNNNDNWQSNNNNDNWQSNDNNNDTWQANNDNSNANNVWENTAANQNGDTWANEANTTQVNAAGDTWGIGNNDSNFQTQTGDLVNAAIANVARDLYGPHGLYYSYRALAMDEPKPDAEEEPRFDVPQSIATERGSSKQVQPGPGYRYYKKCLKPEYLDSLEHPYARFVFKYRSKEQLQKEIGIEVDVEPSSDQAVTELQNLDKQTLVEMLIRAKGALGGKVPSPPLTPLEANGAGPKAIALPAPNYPYLRYSLPSLRPFNANIKPSASTQSKLDPNSQNNPNWVGAQNQENDNNWGAANNSADNGWANNNNNNTNMNTQNWGGASGWDSARDGNRMPSISNQPEQQQQRPSVQFSVQSQNNGQASNSGNASQPTGQPIMFPVESQKENDPNSGEQSVQQPPPPPPPPPLPADNWDGADPASSQTGWV